MHLKTSVSSTHRASHWHFPTPPHNIPCLPCSLLPPAAGTGSPPAKTCFRSAFCLARRSSDIICFAPLFTTLYTHVQRLCCVRLHEMDLSSSLSTQEEGATFPACKCRDRQVPATPPPPACTATPCCLPWAGKGPLILCGLAGCFAVARQLQAVLAGEVSTCPHCPTTTTTASV